MEGLKQEINEKKVQLEKIEKDLENEIGQLQIKENAYQELCLQADEIKKERNEEIISINCSGELYMTKLKTLMALRDTLFYKIVCSKELDLKEVLYFDRNPKYFLMVLDYLRFRRLDIKRLSKEEKMNLRFESEYFEVTELSNQLGEFNAKLEIVEFEHSGNYTYKNKIAGTGRLEDLSDRSLQKGICANSPAWILFTLNDEFTIKEIDVGGFCGNASLWNSANGEGATIQTSVDKITWKTVGVIPNGFGSEIKTVLLNKSIGKYLKFSSTTYLGLGFLSIRAEIS